MQSTPDPEEVSKYVRDVIAGISVEEDAERIQCKGSYDEDLNAYHIFSHASDLGKKVAVIELAEKDLSMDRIMGSMVGMAVGDALGHPFEFEPAQDTPNPRRFELDTFKFINEANTFQLKRGQWTDDAAMGLCMADSLIMRKGFEGSDMRVRFWCWWNRGYNNAFRKDPSRTQSVGLGGNISKSLDNITRKHGGKPPPAYDAKSEDSGNGSLMRFTPIALFYRNHSLEEVYEKSRASSYTTHPGIIAAESCTLLAHLIVRALQLPAGPVNAKEFLDKECEAYSQESGLAGKSGWGYDQMKWLVKSEPVNATESCWNWKREKQDITGTLKARGREYNGYPVSSGYFGSYALDGLALALWAVYHTDSFDAAVTKCVNLCGDADSHGSIAGQIAGALYGHTAINPQFKKWLSQWDDHNFALRALLLAELGTAPMEVDDAKGTGGYNA